MDQLILQLYHYVKKTRYHYILYDNILLILSISSANNQLFSCVNS